MDGVQNSMRLQMEEQLPTSFTGGDLSLVYFVVQDFWNDMVNLQPSSNGRCVHTFKKSLLVLVHEGLNIELGN